MASQLSWKIVWDHLCPGQYVFHFCGPLVEIGYPTRHDESGIPTKETQRDFMYVTYVWFISGMQRIVYLTVKLKYTVNDLLLLLQL